MRHLIGALIVTAAMLTLTLTVLIVHPRIHAPIHHGRPTGDYCSKDGEFMFYRRLISGPNACYGYTK